MDVSQRQALAQAFELGTKEAAEALLIDLYVDLRGRLRFWSALTRQTPQARMGYIGQHLVSVVTGLQGGRSGARGYDLIDAADHSHSEIKTCYRVDQLGNCRRCKAVVSSIEERCPNNNCQSPDIARKDDSKWLLSVRDEQELRELLSPKYYFLVLFDFVTLERGGDINARIWRVDPLAPGFVRCMIDYYFNIKPKQAKGAPFNLWPFDLKFQLMRPSWIYHALIGADDTVRTLRFNNPEPVPVDSFETLKRSTTLSDNVLRDLALRHGVKANGISRGSLLLALQQARVTDNWDEGQLADELSELIYPKIPPAAQELLKKNSRATSRRSR